MAGSSGSSQCERSRSCCRSIATSFRPPRAAHSWRRISWSRRASTRAVHLDIRYATTNNFLGSVFYSSAHAFLQRPAAEALVRAAHVLRRLGYGLLIHDAYRRGM